MNTILIANRGEIASRIIRTCKKMGIRSIAVFSQADRQASYVREADGAVFIGAASPAESYLNQDKLIAAAKKTNADGIHPGYGFLSENADFASRCKKEGIIFIGPNAEAIAAMGSKSNAKKLMDEHGVPVIPGYHGEDQSVPKLQEEAKLIGYPLLLKASAGGGGKGMRIVTKEEEMEAAFKLVKSEAKSSFGDEDLILEKYIENGRHIEIQIFGDQQGNVIHLLERECSIQRRYQKVVEESPSAVINPNLRAAIGEAALKAAKALNYDNAGTVEFVFDENVSKFYFLEVNTRLQVEHPVTEAITGLDLVQMQIESAAGLPLRITQAEVKGNGYAIEARLYAEDASNNFSPVTGTIHRFQVPQVEGLRLETAIEDGSKVSVFYDPMIAKLIVWDRDRQSALQKMTYVLKNLVCLGVKTNLDFLHQLFETKNFQKGNYTNQFVDNEFDFKQLSEFKIDDLEKYLIAACLFGWVQRRSKQTLLRSMPSGWRNNFYEHQKEVFIHEQKEWLVKYRFQNKSFDFNINEQEYKVENWNVSEGVLSFEVDGERLKFSIHSINELVYLHNELFGTFRLVKKDRFPKKVVEKLKGAYEAPMPSQILKIHVELGQKVQSGDELLVLSSMKMENTIYADEEGLVEEIFTQPGSNVEAGFILLKIKSES